MRKSWRNPIRPSTGFRSVLLVKLAMSSSLGASSAVFDSLLGSKANFHSKVNRGAKSLFGQRVGGGGKRGAASSSSNGALGGRSELRPASLDFFSAGFGGGGGGSSPKVAAGKHAAASPRAGATASSSRTTSGSKKRRRSGSKEGKDRTASKQQDDDADDDDVEKQEEEESEEEEEEEESEEEESEEDVTVFGKRRAKAPVEDETRPNVAQHRYVGRVGETAAAAVAIAVILACRADGKSTAAPGAWCLALYV